MSTTATTTTLKGAEWLIKETTAAETYIPEDFNEEQQMVKDMCANFLDTEVFPNLDRIDALEAGLMPSLMDKAGELGLLGTSAPEEFGGLGKDFITSTIVNEALGGGHSFSVAIAAHTGIGTLPILYFGTPAQKAKYIPKLASGEWKGAYGLTEPNSGSDALSAKTTARLSEDGKHFILNGQKCWITNGGFADVYTVFAKIDGKDFTAFIVERGTEGFSQGPEEKKMGIKGSSTRQVFFNNVKVPVENQLYERGQGFKIAVNILNIGRIKLAGGVLGGAKGVITDSVNYANEREQFGRSIAKYGAIRDKIAKMAVRVFALESAVYRATQNIEDEINHLVESGMSKGEATLKGIASYAPECAMLKVIGSEVLDFVADEGVQIHGGMGYSAETRIERSYRDSRINRIFEGTNEINRMLTVDMILKKAMKGELDLMGPAMAVAGELMSIPDFGDAPDNVFDQYRAYIKNFKKAVLMVAGGAAQKLAMTLAKEQEILMNIADMTIQTYTAESLLLRAEKYASQHGEAAASAHIEMMKAFTYDAAEIIGRCGREALVSFGDGDELRMMLMGMKRFTKTEPVNIKEIRRSVAARVIAANKYPF